MSQASEEIQLTPLMKAILDKGLVNRKSVDIWAKRLFHTEVPPGTAPWDRWLMDEWNNKPRNTFESIAEYYDSDAHVVFQAQTGGGWRSPAVDDITRGYLAPRMRVLDYGCGAGQQGRGCAEEGCDVIFADVSPRLLKGIEAMCTEKGITVTLFPVKESFPVLPAPMDFIFAYDVLEHVQEPVKVLERLVAALKVGGHLRQDIFFDDAGGNAPYHLHENMVYGDPQKWMAACEATGLKRVHEETERGSGVWERIR